MQPASVRKVFYQSNCGTALRRRLDAAAPVRPLAVVVWRCGVFIVLDHHGRAPEAITEIAGLIAEGKLTPLETVVEGFKQLPTAINMLFDGVNVGKLVVKVSE
jgi:NADPH-dependent curcumin reductase CurA